MTIEKKKESLKEMDMLGGGTEEHFQDVIKYYEKNQQVFRDFLSRISFSNGYDILKCFSIPNRIKWMKLCCILWDSNERSFNKFFFSGANPDPGIILDRGLSGIKDASLDKKLISSSYSTDPGHGEGVYEYLSKIGITAHIAYNTCMLDLPTKK